MISDVLYRLRIEHGYTQQQVADEIDIERVVYGRYENGQRKPVSENIVKLAKFYGVTTDYILGLTDEAGQEVRTAPQGASGPLDALPPDLRAKAEDYIAMLKLLDESRKKDSPPTGTDDIPKHA